MYRAFRDVLVKDVTLRSVLQSLRGWRLLGTPRRLRSGCGANKFDSKRKLRLWTSPRAASPQIGWRAALACSLLHDGNEGLVDQRTQITRRL